MMRNSFHTRMPSDRLPLQVHLLLYKHKLEPWKRNVIFRRHRSHKPLRPPLVRSEIKSAGAQTALPQLTNAHDHLRYSSGPGFHQSQLSG